MVLGGVVYDITEFLPYHPGGDKWPPWPRVAPPPGPKRHVPRPHVPPGPPQA